MTKTHIYRGYSISQGSFTGTSDDCAGRWYADPISADYYDRRGRGVRTLAGIKSEIDEALAMEADDARVTALWGARINA